MQLQRPTVTGQHMDDAVQPAGCSLEEISAKNTAVFVHSSPEQLFYPKLFLLYCAGSQALTDTALGDAWSG